MINKIFQIFPVMFGHTEGRGRTTPSGVTLPFGAPCSFFAAPTNFLLSPKKKKKKKKKGRHFFSRRPNAKLADIWYILLLCHKIFRLKNCKFANMPPP